MSEEKTRICRIPEGEFDFLDMRSGECFRRGPVNSVLATGRQEKRIQRAVPQVHALTGRSGHMARDHNAGGAKWNTHAARMGELLAVGTVSKAYRALDAYAAMRLRRWLRFPPAQRQAMQGRELSTLPHLSRALRARTSDLGHDVPWTKA